MTRRQRILTTGTAVAILAGLADVAQAANIEVQMDQARVVTFRTAVKTVFVGNPVIADITVIDPRHVFVLGKNFGNTNLIALDQNGNEAANEQITVFGHAGTIVTLQRGIGQMTLNCDGTRCETTPAPGDDTAQYDAVTGQIDKRDSMNVKAAAGQ